MKISKLLLMALAMTIATTASAQTNAKKQKDYYPAPYMFVGLQGGVTKPFVNNSIERKFVPMGQITFGAYFTPWLGARLQGSGWTFDTDLLGTTTTYNSKYYGGGGDLLLNLSGIVFPKRHNLVNVVLLGGVAKHYAKFDSPVTSFLFPLSLKGDRWVTTSRLGGQIDLNVAKHFGIQLEGGAQYVYDQINGFKVDKWGPYALLGLNYKFAFRKKAVEAIAPAAVIPTPVVTENVQVAEPEPAVVEPTPAPEPKPEVKEEPKPVVVEQPAPKAAKLPETTRADVFFRIGSASVMQSEQSTISQIVKWANEHPTAKFTLTGYADRGTGNPRINQALSERRAAAVKDQLIKKGVSASRITATAKGDSEQPFADNDKNRVVIALGEE